VDKSTEEAFKAILKGIATAEVANRSMIDEVAAALELSASQRKSADDPVSVQEIGSLAAYARKMGE